MLIHSDLLFLCSLLYSSMAFFTVNAGITSLRVNGLLVKGHVPFILIQSSIAVLSKTCP